MEAPASPGMLSLNSGRDSYRRERGLMLDSTWNTYGLKALIESRQAAMRKLYQEANARASKVAESRPTVLQQLTQFLRLHSGKPAQTNL
ncbi:MAG TPA: hypothetical protein VD902_12235 [Symbiobacteriaceae bacterium]|nr:hypothetical protein [Symbiobacteriaceae bacterium]